MLHQYYYKSSPILVPNNEFTQNATSMILGKTDEQYILRKMPPFNLDENSGKLSYDNILHRKVFLEKIRNRIPLGRMAETGERTGTGGGGGGCGDCEIIEQTEPLLEISIPFGKKYCLWFCKIEVSSFKRGHKNNVCYLLEFDKNRIIHKIELISSIPAHLHTSNNKGNNSFYFPAELCENQGTILFGTIIKNDFQNFTTSVGANGTNGSFGTRSTSSSSASSASSIFIIENLFYYKGNDIRHLSFCEKLFFMENFLFLMENMVFTPFCVENEQKNSIKSPFTGIFNEKKHNNKYLFALPYIRKWNITDNQTIGEISDDNYKYKTHHIELRKINPSQGKQNIKYNVCSMDCVQCRNLHVEVEVEVEVEPAVSVASLSPSPSKFIMDFKTHQHKYPTVFMVMADIQYDIYHLYAVREDPTTAAAGIGMGLDINNYMYYNVAYIPNIKSSIFMNNIFRYIKENQNIDYIEESDDEEDYENNKEDKYVNLTKMVPIECIFNYKFKKWVPERVLTDTFSKKVVGINKLGYFIRNENRKNH